MVPPTGRLLAPLLIVLALGLCAPEEEATRALASRRVADGAQAHLTPTCDAASGEEFGPAASKMMPAVAAMGGAAHARLDPAPVASVLPASLAAPHGMPGDVPVSRAPPLA